MKRILKTAIITFLSGAIFFGASFAYLDHSLGKPARDTDQKDYTVPYIRTPESQGIAIVFPSGSATLAYLDFDEECIRLLDIENFDESCPEYYGYTVDYSIQISYELIEGIVDRVGGIELEIDGQKQRYTGVQVIDHIAYGRAKDMKREIVLQVFDKISKNNFSKDDFVYIIENSEGNLSFVDCIVWLDYLKDMSGRVQFVN